jgi:hypothetical protein
VSPDDEPTDVELLEAVWQTKISQYISYQRYLLMILLQCFPKITLSGGATDGMELVYISSDKLW